MMEVAARDFPDDVFKATVHGLVDDGDVRYIRIVPSLRFLLDIDFVLPYDLQCGEATEDGWLFSEVDMERCVAERERGGMDYDEARYELKKAIKYHDTGDIGPALKVMVLDVVRRLFNDPDFWLPWLQARADHADSQCKDLPTRRDIYYDSDVAECVCRDIQSKCCYSLYRLRSGVNVVVFNYHLWRRPCDYDDEGKDEGYSFVMTSTAPGLAKGGYMCEFTMDCVREWLREGKLVPCEQEVKAKA